MMRQPSAHFSAQFGTFGFAQATRVKAMALVQCEHAVQLGGRALVRFDTPEPRRPVLARAPFQSTHGEMLLDQIKVRVDSLALKVLRAFLSPRAHPLPLFAEEEPREH